MSRGHRRTSYRSSSGRIRGSRAIINFQSFRADALAHSVQLRSFSFGIAIRESSHRSPHELEIVVTLLARVNLTLGAAFILGVGISGFVAHRILEGEAQREGLATVQLMLASAAASRDYTRDEIAPLLAPQLAERFVPQMVPSYAATHYVERLRADRPAFVYREATLNPTNPRDRAADWEADIVNHFRSDKSIKEVSGERMTPSGLSFYLARPIRVSSADCLVCHGSVSSAPATMTAIYGGVNGFGWQMNEIIGSQIMSVPVAAAHAQADENFMIFMSALIGIFLVVFILVNVLIHVMVLKPISRMARISEQVSNGDLSGPGFAPSGKDEIAQLGRSFERMRRSLAKSVALLGG
jgi:HAMP domain-containing protein